MSIPTTYNLQPTARRILFVLLLVVSCWSLVGVSHALAQAQPTEYQLLAPLPLDGIESGVDTSTTAEEYIAGIFKLTIALAGVFAVVMIIFGGIEYMSSDAFSGKNDAKNRIQNAIWGLLLIIGAWLILFTINEDLVKFNFDFPSQDIASTTARGGAVCSNCVTFDSLGIPTSGSANGKSIAPFFGDKLIILNNRLNINGIGWTVTEGYPPSVPHASTCHNIGTCVDAKLLDPSAANINRFFTIALGAGLGASYEVQTAAEEQALVSAGVNPAIIDVNSNATGPHFHIR